MSYQAFENRTAAGRALALVLSAWQDRSDALVVALPRGGVPVAAELARSLHLPLEVLVVCRICLQDAVDLAIGAVAADRSVFLNQELLARQQTSDAAIEQAERRAHKEIQYWERLYRQEQPWPDLTGKTLLVVDDGIASSDGMATAIQALRHKHPARIMVVTPTASALALARLSELADEVLALQVSEPFAGVAASYRDYARLDDEAIFDLLKPFQGTALPSAALPGIAAEYPDPIATQGA